MEKKYSLLFEGLIDERRTIDEVKMNLKELFGISQENINLMFRSGEKTLIKHGLSYAAAIDGKTSFEKSGALCRIVESFEGKEVQSLDVSFHSLSTEKFPAPGSFPLAQQNFYYQRAMKFLWTVILLMMLSLILILIFCLKSLPFNISDMPTEGVTVLGTFSILFFLLCLYSAWLLWQPVLTFSEQGIEQKLTRFFRSDFVAWHSIQGMSVAEQSYKGKLQRTVKLIISSDQGKNREWIFAIDALDGGEDAIAILRKMVPEKKSQDFFRRLELLKPLQIETVCYRDIEVTREGIFRKGEKIIWDRITSLTTESLVIAGYGSVAVRYTGGVNELIIKSSSKKEYLDCIRLILSMARNATVDPGIIGMLEYPPAAAKKDNYAIFLLVAGIPLALGGLVILLFYPPTVGSTWLYPLLLIPLALVPFVWTLKLLSARFQGGTAGSSRKIIAATFFNLGTVLSVAILFSLSPSSFLWLMADTAALTGQMDQAESLYMKAEPALNMNEDFIFTLGQFYSLKKDWNRAAEYYIRSYEKDPTNWMAEPLANIPNSLSKAGRDEEALQWCDRILGRYAGNSKVIRVIERKKREIKLCIDSKNHGI